jgi:hypothetical protein
MKHLLLLILLLAACPDGRVDRDDDDATDDDDAADDDDSGIDDDDATADDDDTGSDDDDVAPDDDDTGPADPCLDLLRQTNVGCEFWAVDLDNAENLFGDDAAAAQFAVVVAHASPEPSAFVEVHINLADPGQPLSLQLVDSATIPQGGLHVFELPRRDVDGENVTNGHDDGPQTWLSSRAFRVTSTAPVVAYQFNTLDQQFSNDASLLLPTHSLGDEHHVVGHFPNAPTAGLGENRAYVTVVGAHEATSVQVTPAYDVISGPGVPDIGGGIGILAGTTKTFTLGPFDVLNLETPLISLFPFPPPPIPDLTGTVVTSDLPVAVFTGADLANISDGTGAESCCAEHIEQQVLPTRAMRTQFVVSHSAQRSTSTPENDVYRVLAIADGTAVTTNLGGADASFSLAAGEFREFFANTGFVLQASAPVHVAQFLVKGSDVPSGNYGDNSLLYVPPVDQRRGTYTFTTGEGFSRNAVVISMVEGTVLTVDGLDSTLPASGCGAPQEDGELNGQTYVSVTCDIDDGVHQVHSGAVADEAGDPLGVYVYGYYNAGSYAYPAGAGLGG